uniref:Putative ATP-binding protein n=1 Tax=Candidatus Methanogaster sp. ANME-2c ERB4 TaxID=2759911 RepID=A0A7G9YNI3_9EURY|nr:putative ATP-binding protein [Methanosarcinales archaeon ANME-2c ERB4]
MKRIAFHDREREAGEIMKILDAEPSLITFVYGPINSGKTTMISHLIKELPEDCAPFYVNLRGGFITDYEDFLNVLFEIDEAGGVDNVTEYAKSILKDLGAVSGIPIPINLFEQIFEKKDKSKDMFKYMEQFFVEISKKRTPVLIIDELQVVGDIKIDGFLMYKLFNFFIRLTKELHLCHVFAATSDSLFIEQVYSEAMLEGRCRYLLVDDFDYKTTAAFLEDYGFTDEETAVAWEYCGGKPICLVELVNAQDDRRGKAEEMLKIRRGQIEEIVYSLEARDREMFDAVMRVLSEFIGKENVEYKYISDGIKFLVGKNVIFADSANKELRPQSKLNLLAIREVMSSV